MKYFFWGIVMIVVGVFAACNGDRIYSEHLFEQYCNEEGRTGQFINERVGLADEFFRDIPSKTLGIEIEYFLNDKKHLIDEVKFHEHYIEKYKVENRLSFIGPIYSYESSVLRKSDGKILGKAVSLVNKKGWFSETALLWINVGTTCPRHKAEDGTYLANSDHITLINKIFHKI